MISACRVLQKAIHFSQFSKKTIHAPVHIKFNADYEFKNLGAQLKKNDLHHKSMCYISNNFFV